MAEKVREFKGGPGARGRGPRPKLRDGKTTFKRLIGYILKNYTPQLILVVVCIIVGVLANVQGTLFTRTLIDSYILPMIGNPNPDFGPLAAAIGRVACFYAIGAVSTFLYNRIMVNVSQGTLKSLRDDLFIHMESLPIRYFDTHSHGDIMSIYTNDTDTLRQMISQSMPQLLSSAITIISVLASMIMLNLPLTCLSLAMIYLMTRITKAVSKQSSKFFVAQQRNLGATNGYIEEMINGQKVVKVFCHEQESVAQFTQLNENLFQAAYNANKFANILGPINAQLGNVSYVLVAVVGGLLALNHVGGFTLGGLASFLTFNRSVNMPISQISMQLNSVIMALAGAERVFDLLDEASETDEGTVELVRVDHAGPDCRETTENTGHWAWKKHDDGKITLVPLDGNVVFTDVDFGYDPKKVVLHDVSLYAKAGQKIAFVGSTGAGKTTITNLINRFYDIQSGTITFDGINVQHIKKADLRRSLGIVLQDTHLFTGTVMENIRYGNLNATDEQVIAAARLANADGFINHLPEGYDTQLTGDGANLSQGQRQLLAIARAAVADPPVLILDEATSSIDTRTERIVQDGMDKLMHGRTVFVIAHRLSTVQNSNCIMVLEQGHIIERGTHDQLIEEKGKYYQLYTGNFSDAE